MAQGAREFSWDTVILDASKLPDEPLHGLFQRCFLAHKHLNDLPRDASTAQELLRCVLRMLQHCDVLVDAAALFSANEEQDDIQTSSLRFLLVEHLTANVLAATREQNLRDRLMSIALACRHHRSFLKRLQRHRMLPPHVDAAVRRQEEGQEPSPQVARTAKIEARQAEQRLEQQVARLHAACSAHGDADDTSTIAGLDEEQQRELWLAWLHLAAARSCAALGVLKQEQEMLAQMRGRADEDLDDAALQAQEKEQEEVAAVRAAMRTKLLSIASDMSSASTRQEARSTVFQPSHNLPTISVEQAGAIELKQAQEQERFAQQRAAQHAAAQAAKSADQLDDEELAQQRAWDDWKDEHPTGYGNSKLRPCAT